MTKDGSVFENSEVAVVSDSLSSAQFPGASIEDSHQPVSKGPFLRVTVVVPTLNAAQVLRGCLESVRSQHYPQELIDILIADGGSDDGTQAIAEDYQVRILSNSLRTGEAGKAIGAAEAKGDIIAFIDSDNLLPHADWMDMMTRPFVHPDIMASEPLYWDIENRGLSLVDRYCALTGVNDPLCLSLGNYGRYSYLTGDWTGMKVNATDRDGFLDVKVLPGELPPTMGANGFLIRRDIYQALGNRMMLFDIDLIAEAATTLGSFRIARVHTSITHFYAATWREYRRKALRRANDFLYFTSLGQRQYPWARMGKMTTIRFVVNTLLVVPTLVQALRGYRRIPDRAWFFHPAACLLTGSAYFEASLFRVWRGPRLHSRTGWRQR
jgi:glycosyltransferase involved in cell wall biosynthesis